MTKNPCSYPLQLLPRLVIRSIARRCRVNSTPTAANRCLFRRQCLYPSYILAPQVIRGNLRDYPNQIQKASNTRRYISSTSILQENEFKNKPKVPNATLMPRTAISILGGTNAGKSVLMNLLTQSNVSIVHETAGTTTDPKICSMELHGNIGPVRLLDTPGIDEIGQLGQLKRTTALNTIGQCDVAIIVIDPFKHDNDISTNIQCTVDILKQVYQRQKMNEQAEVATNGPIPLIIYNLRKEKVEEVKNNGKSIPLLLDQIEQQLIKQLEDKGNNNNKKKSTSTLPPTLAVDFTAIDDASRDRVIGFIERYVNPRNNTVRVLPDTIIDTHEQGYSPTVFLNIPMDQQTPAMRLLRPQAMVQESLIRNFVSTYAYRMDLNMARSDDPKLRQIEKDRFLRVLDPLLSSGDLSLMITDSQAIDIVAPWTLDNDGNEIIPITTFSITMIRYLSGGRLDYFVDGLRKLDEMMIDIDAKHSKDGNKWRILIAEACNHTRLNMEKQCADIGTVQLPNHFTDILHGNVEFEYAFGKHVLFDPTRFDLVVHCGGCMLNQQQMDARVADLMSAGVPATNYGLLLSRIQSPRALSRVLQPWGINYNYNNEEDDDHDHHHNSNTGT